MTSFIDSLAASEKTAVVIDLGHVYTKTGFAGNSSPRHIVPTTVNINGETKELFQFQDDKTILREELLPEFIRSIYYKYNIANCRERRVVVVESVVTPSRTKHLLAEILLKQFEASSLAFVSSHLAATYTLGRSTALVLDLGYKEAQILPVAEGVPLAVNFNSVPYASQAIHKKIQSLLEEHGHVIDQGKKQTLREKKLVLSEKILEDIKVRCCFVSPFDRAQNSAKENFKHSASIDYSLGPETVLHIPGIVREFSCEVLFEQDIDGKSVGTLILDALVQAPLDLRRPLAENILVIGGTAMLPGFLHRLNAELTHLANLPNYVNKLALKTFHFHSPPGKLNFVSWLGGSIVGALDTLETQSILREKFLDNGLVPDWFTGEQAA